MTMKPTQAEPGKNPARMTEAEYWEWQTRSVYRRTLEMAWVVHHVPQLAAYAAKWPRSQAFVLGTGPSLEEVLPNQWSKIIKRWFTVGVNFFPAYWQDRFSDGFSDAIRGEFFCPRLAFLLDRMAVDTPVADRMVKSLETLRQAGGKVLAGFDAVGFPHDWACPTFGMTPKWDLDFGLSTTAQYSMFFSRSTVAMVHLLLCLGFRNVCLLGVDHGADYKKREPERAAFVFECLAAFAEQRGARIWQCGERAGFDARGIRRKKLDAVISGRWEGTR